MRIAYITPYQGPGLLKGRPPVMQHLGLAANLKIELVSELMLSRQHSIEVLSQGEVATARGKRFYPGFRETSQFSPAIPVFYASAMPVRGVNGLWSACRVLQLFQRRHRVAPFDAVIVYNLQLPQVVCALYSVHRLGLPVLLEYEDDAVVDIAGRPEVGRGRWQLPLVRSVLDSVSACAAVSPHLLSRVTRPVPKMLLRGVVSQDILQQTRDRSILRRQWVVFSGTHSKAKGLEPLLKAWSMLKLPDWELHIAGYGEKTELLKRMTQDNPSVTFHGILNRAENASLLREATIGINPHDLSETPGNVFAFKIIEYLAAGTHVITTPMGPLEPELEAGLTYMPDNSPQTIAATLRTVIAERWYERHSTKAAQDLYGPASVAESLDALLTEAAATSVGGRSRIATARGAATRPV